MGPHYWYLFRPPTVGSGCYEVGLGPSSVCGCKLGLDGFRAVARRVQGGSEVGSRLSSAGSKVVLRRVRVV